jgi:hypothetical protein
MDDIAARHKKRTRLRNSHESARVHWLVTAAENPSRRLNASEFRISLSSCYTKLIK